MESHISSFSVLGMDVSKAKIDFSLHRAGKFKSKVFPNTSQGFNDLAAWLVKQDAPLVHACCEATGTYWEAVAKFLFEAGHRVSVINPAQISAFAQSRLQRNKTDKQDAQLIAQFCLTQSPPLWQPPPAHEQALLALVRDLHVLQDMQQAEENRLPVAHSEVKPRIERHLDWLKKEIDRLQNDIDQHIDRHPDLKSRAKLLATIPGVGDRTLPWLLAYLGDGTRFKQAKQAAAYSGLAPRQWESGSSVRGKSRISKVGHSDIRRALYMPAVVAYSRIAYYRPFVERLKQAGKIPMVIITALMRKLVTIAQAILKSGKPFDKSLQVA